jgi:hypothetical protein
MIPTFTTPAHILDESLMRLLFHINNPEFDISLHSDPLDYFHFTSDTYTTCFYDDNSPDPLTFT